MFLNAFHLWGDAICSTVFLLFLIFVACMFFRVWRREPRLVARISVCVRVVGIGFIHLLIFEHIQNHSNVCAKVNSDIVSDALLGIAFCTPLAQLPVPPRVVKAALCSGKVSDACLCQRLSVSLLKLLGQ